MNQLTEQEPTLVILQKLAERIKEDIKNWETQKPEDTPENKNKFKKAKNILIHHFKQMLFGQIIYYWSLEVFKSKQNIHQLQDDILSFVRNIDSQTGFKIEDRDVEYLKDKMDFLWS